MLQLFLPKNDSLNTDIFKAYSKEQLRVKGQLTKIS